MSVDRRKYLLGAEARQLSAVCEAAADSAIRRGIGYYHVLTWALVDIALQTGLRVSEILSLVNDNFDLFGRSLEVRRSKKKKVTIETIGISRLLADHLIKFKKQQQDQGISTSPSDHVLIANRGPLTRQGASDKWARALRSAGLPHRGVHGARHTLAVALLKKTGNLRLVQKQLGHSSPVTTANLYADVPFEDCQAALEGVYL